MDNLCVSLCHMTVAKRFPGFTVNMYNIWSLYTVWIFCHFRTTIIIFDWFCETWIQRSIIHMAFVLSDCVLFRGLSADSYLQTSRVRFIQIHSDLLILYKVYCTYCNSDHFLSIHMNYSTWLRCQQCFAQWFLASLFCFVSLHALWFPICVVNIKHNITACDYFHSFPKEVRRWCETLSEEGVLVGGGLTVSPKRRLLAYITRNAPSALLDGAARGVWEWHHLSEVCSARWHPCAAAWRSPTSHSKSNKNASLVKRVRLDIFYGCMFL